MHTVRFILSFLVLAVFLSLGINCFGMNAECAPCDSVCIRIHFRFDDALVLRDYRGEALEQLQQILTDNSTYTIDHILLSGGSSLEGVSEHNVRLTWKRAVSLKGYLLWKYPHISSASILTRMVEDHAEALIEAVRKETAVPRQDKAIEILERNSSNETKIANLKLLSGGTYSYIERYLFPHFRSVVSCVIYIKPLLTKSELIVTAQTESHERDVTTRPFSPVEPTPKDSILAVIEQPIEAPLSTVITWNSPIALKTNLLFDLGTLANIEIEVPIGRRFSIAGEWIFPWWLWEKKQNCLQVLSGNIEARYWLGNRTIRPLLTGWFTGLYAGAGLYDLEWDKEGYQGEFFIAAGVSVGYAHKIGHQLSMEYSVGIGYMRTKYRQYNAQWGIDNVWHLIRKNNGRFTWVGPTRAKISLVWTPSFKYKKKGGSN